ncbi:hypothetical protein [Janibacter terrae]|uniref:hypothetical protein n=1 Tax=Janibacter terrae TaxID=103817 RepID=UPI0008332C26|nr:hypothetical protein [Janibacter terrae]
MSEHELEEQLHRWGEGGSAHRDEPVSFAGVRARVQRRRRQRLVGVAAAAAVAVAVPLGWAAVAGTGGASTAPATELDRPACPQKAPQRRGGGLGAPTSSKVDPGALVPDGEVVAVTVCRYDKVRFGRQTTSALEGTRTLDHDLDALVADLREVASLEDVQRGGCLIGSASTPYLARLDYPDGHAWIAAGEDNTCGYAFRDTTNGVEVFDHVGHELAQAYRDRAWPGLRGSACEAPTALRRGQADQLVPGDPVEATVCWSVGQDERHEEIDDVDALVEALRAAPVRATHDSKGRPISAWNGSCGFGGDERQLLLRYDSGPDHMVWVRPRCRTQLNSDSLRAQLTPELATILGVDID